MTTITGRPDPAASLRTSGGHATCVRRPELAQTGLGKYVEWLADRGRRFDSYLDLWAWSVDDLEDFWASLWDYFDVPGSPGNCVLTDRAMPGANWFPTARLNYAECILARRRRPRPSRHPRPITDPRAGRAAFGELAEQVRRSDRDVLLSGHWRSRLHLLLKLLKLRLLLGSQFVL